MSEAPTILSPLDRAKAFKCFLKPQGSRIVILEDQFRYEGKIIIPSTSERRGTTGRIVAHGPDVDVDRYPLYSRIVFATFSGTSIGTRNKDAKSVDELRVLQADSEVLAFIETDDLQVEYTAA